MRPAARKISPHFLTGFPAVVLGLWLTTSLASGPRDVFLPGTTSDGHYQIELDCEACHDPFGGVREESCHECHGDQLETSRDTHPKSKFTDPRNADRVELLDARKCVTCHREHVPDRTLPMTLTEPRDYCFHCHEDIATDRPSHAGLAFTTCADAGCHNFHDNRDLYEDFIAKHVDDPDHFEDGAVPALVGVGVPAHRTAGEEPPASGRNDAPPGVRVSAGAGAAMEMIVADWSASAHATGGVSCTGCHGGPATGRPWSNRVGRDACLDCHPDENDGFEAGRHGMRLALGMTPMEPSLARLPMRADAAERSLDCHACHPAHDYDVRRAAAEACLGCHADEHSLAWDGSPHHELWVDEIEGRAPAGAGVSCATCHLPRREVERGGRVAQVLAVHDQNDNLRPVDKMLRSVCLRCHGLEFAIDALADASLGEANFDGESSVHVASVDWVRARLEERAPRTDGGAVSGGEESGVKEPEE